MKIELRGYVDSFDGGRLSGVGWHYDRPYWFAIAIHRDELPEEVLQLVRQKRIWCGTRCRLVLVKKGCLRWSGDLRRVVFYPRSDVDVNLEIHGHLFDFGDSTGPLAKSDRDIAYLFAVEIQHRDGEAARPHMDASDWTCRLTLDLDGGDNDSRGEQGQAMTTSEDFERRMYEYVILREDMDRLERAQKFGCKVSDFNVVVTGLGEDEAEKDGQ